MAEWKRVDGAAIVEKAREYIGTPWRHAQRLKGVGIDCAGLLVCTLVELGVNMQDKRDYSRGDELATMLAGMDHHATRVQTGEDWRAGDVLVFRNMGALGTMSMTNHCAIYTGPEEDGIIHAWASMSVGRKVVEHPMDDFWRGSVVAVFRYRGIA